MKTQNIYVGINGATLQMTGGKAVAVYAAKKGDTESYLLMESGNLATLKGNRIQGVGAARFLTENGFKLAEPGDPQAQVLADMLDIRAGTKLVEEATRITAITLQQLFGGKQAVFIPFDAEQPLVTVTVKPPAGFSSVAFDLAQGISSGSVSLEYDTALGMMNYQVSNGWLVAPNEDASKYPRGTEYGGLVERAMHIMASAGLGTLVGNPHLEMAEDAAEGNNRFPRGSMTLKIANGDELVAGINAVDDLVVDYVRNGTTVYSREGMSRPRLGEVVGCIAAVLVRVPEMDAVPEKKSRKK
ncbi:hypothetical protein LC612_36715 [Nostoc sp. CHAB 5834]|nr:hypothetical protein [Nostoc sp. CHAB 5834]